MKNNRFFKKPNLLEIPKKRFLESVIYAFIAAVSIYSFLTLIRYIMRSMEFGFHNWALILDDYSIRFWQNINFALIAVVLGNSIGIINLFKKPFNLGINKLKRASIINDQFFLGFGFFHWFIKFFYLFFIFIIELFGIYFLNDLWWLGILLFLTLYLNSWKTIILIYRTATYKYMALNFLILVFITVLLANTSVWDYKALDRSLINTNPPLDLPMSDFASSKDGYNYNQIKLVKSEKGYKYLYNGEKFNSINELKVAIINSYHLTFMHRVTAKILAPSDTPISVIKEIEGNLFFNEIYRVIYITRSSFDVNKGRFSSSGILKRLYAENVINFKDSENPPPPFYPSLIEKSDTILNVKISDSYFIDDKLIPKENLIKKFIKHIDSTTTFNYLIDREANLQDYITLFGAHQEAIEILKTKDQKVFPIYNTPFRISNSEAYEDELTRLEEKYPLLVKESYTY